ncbi:LysR family transcriptional regulator [Bacteriovoracaceae bacterium]|nr:LysR family transcriptional regulator [Bacteriovoracaceae bacterium]
MKLLIYLMGMSISSIQLDAFHEVAKQLNFSKAAKMLGVTQSALSQRIKNLELDLGVTVFIRERSFIKLTESGEKLLRYCLVRSSIEGDLLGEIQSDYRSGADKQYSGIIRVAAYSSILRSVIIPSLNPFLIDNPNVQCEFIKGEMNELIEMLKSGEADLIILDHALGKSKIVEEEIGFEEYVVIENSKRNERSNVYLDNNPDDNATEAFFSSQAKKPEYYRRTFMGDVYGILDGVEAGLGRAVMSKHLVPKTTNIKRIKGYSKYVMNVTMHYFDQPYYPSLFNEVKMQILDNSKKYFI